MESLEELRHHLHKHPETAYKEFETAKTLKAYLVNAGYSEEQFVNVAISGFYVDVVGTGAPSDSPRCIALRTDMDALKMDETNPTLPYVSVNHGAAHACGHDGHMASLIGTAIRIKQQEHLIPSNSRVRLLFQPAEEGENGAVKMIEDGCLNGVDEIYGVHNMPYQTLGDFYCPDETIMASFTSMTIRIRGRGAHGAYPEKAQDVVLAMANMLTSLATITGRAISCHESAVFTLCKIEAGSASNVMPDLASMTGTLRTFKAEVKEVILGRINTIITSIAAAFEVTAELEILRSSPATVNSKEHAGYVREAVADCFGQDHVINDVPSSASEDYAYYLKEVPGAFIFAYSGSPGALHVSNYNFEDKLIPYIGKVYMRILSKRLGVELSF
mmetsp:Transcript_13265/g.24873  ORF Transcript_13265/g.24873 Transcript_13265/m.24873 type:complete len:387 (+) Transcript_13265:883-2043(+)